MLFEKNKFPMNIFIVFEKVKPVVYTSQTLTSNHFVCLIPSNWYKNINIFMKNELFLATTFLVDSTIIDLLKYNDNIMFLNEKKRFLKYNIYYTYMLKNRLTLLQLFKTPTLDTIDNIYYNSSWLERENSEMYGINYINKKDNRSLLLDYSRNEYPMLKDFPTEGYDEIYFDFFENKINYIKNEFIEL